MIYWPDLLTQWCELPRSVQYRTARHIGQRLHQLWRGGIDLHSLPLELTTFERRPGLLLWQIGKSLCHRRDRILSIESLRACLLDWNGSLGHCLSPMATELLLRGLLRQEGLDIDQIRCIAADFDSGRQARLNYLPSQLYRQALRIGQGRFSDIYRGHWAPNSQLSPALLATAVNKIERDGLEPLFKSTRKTKLRRANLLGRDVIIKRFDLPSPRHRLQGLFRISRGRRAWAAGKAFEGIGIPTPPTLGYLEIKGRWLPDRSYVFTEFQKDSFDLRTWLKQHHTVLTPDLKTWVEARIEDMFMQLYSARIYHTDTKLSNLLAIPAHQTEKPWAQLMWIDLESTCFNSRPIRHRVTRNLVQLNGSIRDAWMPRRDRLQFLMRMARHFPWLLSSRTINHMTRWTQRRWRRERDTRCGP